MTSDECIIKYLCQHEREKAKWDDSGDTEENREDILEVRLNDSRNDMSGFGTFSYSSELNTSDVRD
jgi:hypothetical protein